MDDQYQRHLPTNPTPLRTSTRYSSSGYEHPTPRSRESTHGDSCSYNKSPLSERKRRKGKDDDGKRESSTTETSSSATSAASDANASEVVATRDAHEKRSLHNSATHGNALHASPAPVRPNAAAKHGLQAQLHIEGRGPATDGPQGEISHLALHEAELLMNCARNAVVHPISISHPEHHSAPEETRVLNLQGGAVEHFSSEAYQGGPMNDQETPLKPLTPEDLMTRAQNYLESLKDLDSDYSDENDVNQESSEGLPLPPMPYLSLPEEGPQPDVKRRKGVVVGKADFSYRDIYAGKKNAWKKRKGKFWEGPGSAKESRAASKANMKSPPRNRRRGRARGSTVTTRRSIPPKEKTPENIEHDHEEDRDEESTKSKKDSTASGEEVEPASPSSFCRHAPSDAIDLPPPEAQVDEGLEPIEHSREEDHEEDDSESTKAKKDSTTSVEEVEPTSPSSFCRHAPGDAPHSPLPESQVDEGFEPIRHGLEEDREEDSEITETRQDGTTIVEEDEPAPSSFCGDAPGDALHSPLPETQADEGFEPIEHGHEEDQEEDDPGMITEPGQDATAIVEAVEPAPPRPVVCDHAPGDALQFLFPDEQVDEGVGPIPDEALYQLLRGTPVDKVKIAIAYSRHEATMSSLGKRNPPMTTFWKTTSHFVQDGGNDADDEGDGGMLKKPKLPVPAVQYSQDTFDLYPAYFG